MFYWILGIVETLDSIIVLWRQLTFLPGSACRIYPDQGSNPCLLNRQADSLPLSHQTLCPVLFIGRTNAEAETPILWPPDVKNQPIGKDPDARKDWWREQKRTTEDEMVGWHHQLYGPEFEQAPGVGDGQGGLACCSPRGCKELDTTERLNWTEERLSLFHCSLWQVREQDLCGTLPVCFHIKRLLSFWGWTRKILDLRTIFWSLSLTPSETCLKQTGVLKEWSKNKGELRDTKLEEISEVVPNVLHSLPMTWYALCTSAALCISGILFLFTLTVWYLE